MTSALARLGLCAASVTTLLIAMASDSWEPWPGAVATWAIWALWEHAIYTREAFDKQLTRRNR